MESAIVPLGIPPSLAGTPQGPPKYAVQVDGQSLADPRATRALLALMNQHAIIGGAAAHWGGPAAFAEIMSALHGIMFRPHPGQWFERYNFVNDAGHAENGLYALRANYGFDGLNFDDLKGFRSLASKLTGHGEAHVNPGGVLISNGPLGSGLGVAQGLALADGVAGRERLTVCTISDGAMMEGEAREALAAIAGLWRKNLIPKFLLIVSDNNTKLSGRIDQDSFSMEPTFGALSALGWEVERQADGHDLAQLFRRLDGIISTIDKPVALVCRTIKGKGVRQTEEAANGGHGYPLKARDAKLPDFLRQIYGGGDPPQEFVQWAQEILRSGPAPKGTGSPGQKVQAGIGRAAIRAAREGAPLFSLSADLQGSTGLAAFHKEFPRRFVDVGVAEANMISSAIGFSKQGFIPLVDTFSQFGVTKGNLPLMMASLSEAALIAIFSHTGFQDAADGASHQATTYFSCVSGIPHTTVINCCCASEAEEALYTAIKRFEASRLKGETPETTILFMGRETFPEKLPGNPAFCWGKAHPLTRGKDVAIAASGPMVWQALAAAESLKNEGIAATVINVPFVNAVDVATLSQCLASTGGRLITLEDHQLIAGQGAMIAHALALAGVSAHLKSLGIGGGFGRSAYKSADLYRQHNLDAQAVAAAARELLG